MLTVNADDHALIKNYHKTDDEKRMVVILNDDSYDAWLNSSPKASIDIMRQYPAEQLRAVPSPLATRAKKKPSLPTELE